MAAAVAAVYVLVRRVVAARVQRLAAAPGGAVWSRLGVEPDGRPVVVAFSTASCAECRVQERQLRHLGDVRIVSVDAVERAGAAAGFGVLTVPATVVLRPDGSVAAVNNGLADAGRLRSQLRSDEATERAAAG